MHTRIQARACLFCNVKQFWAYPAAQIEKDQLLRTRPSITWLIFCSEIVFMILRNFWETMILILLGNLLCSLKFQEISHKIGLLIFPRWWYAWTSCCLAHDCSYCDEKLHEQIVLHDTNNCFQSTFRLYMKWHNQKVVKIINWLSFITPTSYYLI